MNLLFLLRCSDCTNSWQTFRLMYYMALFLHFFSNEEFQTFPEYSSLVSVQVVMAEARSQQAASMTEFYWLGHRFPISNAKTRVSILKGLVLSHECCNANSISYFYYSWILIYWFVYHLPKLVQLKSQKKICMVRPQSHFLLRRSLPFLKKYFLHIRMQEAASVMIWYATLQPHVKHV